MDNRSEEITKNQLTEPNVVAVTLLPQVIAPPLTPHEPLLVEKVTPLPDVVNVMVAQVWVLQVPRVRRQPVPDAARRYPLLGMPVVCINTSIQLSALIFVEEEERGAYSAAATSGSLITYGKYGAAKNTMSKII